MKKYQNFVNGQRQKTIQHSQSAPVCPTSKWNMEPSPRTFRLWHKQHVLLVRHKSVLLDQLVAIWAHVHPLEMLSQSLVHWTQ